MSSASAVLRRSVAVVVPTYNNLTLLRQCLRSIARLDYPPELLEVVVVDNGSNDGTAQALSQANPDVRLVRLEKNTGFAPACNRGAEEASSDYVAFLNDDAVADPQWLNHLFAALDTGGEGTVCAASRILSHDGTQIEYNGASSNVFGVGRPRPVWGWPDSPQPPGEGDPVLFASGGAMLIHRRTFLDAGGFDPNFFAYFEDVDLGWRLWVLGYKVVYAPDATVRHIGGATGSRQAAHRRYTLWECNSLAVIIKNYESSNMERMLSAGLMLLYKRALMSAEGSFNRAAYKLSAAKDTNPANVERLPRVSVAHLAAIDRLNANMQHFMQERRLIQARRVRPDLEILPLLGRLWEPQFAGEEYAAAVRALAASLDLYSITEGAAPNLVLILAGDSIDADNVASKLASQFQVALVRTGQPQASTEQTGIANGGYTLHHMAAGDPALQGLVTQADAVLLFPGAIAPGTHLHIEAPLAVFGDDTSNHGHRVSATFSGADDPGIVPFCRQPA